MSETDQEKAKRWCEMASDRLREIHQLEKETTKLLKVVQRGAKTARQLIRQRDGLLDLIALAMEQEAQE